MVSLNNMISTRQVVNTFLVIFLSNFIFGCFKPVEDCLDIRATNFKADADENCCCTWPELSLSVTHNMGELLHSPQDTYSTANGETYRLIDATIILSDFKLYFAGGGVTTMLDTILLAKSDGTSSYFPDDIVVLERSKSTVAIGSFLGSGQLDSFSFLIGLPENLEQIQPESFPADHPLRSTTYPIWDISSGYADLRTIHVPIPGTDTVFWELRDAVRITLPSEKMVSIGSSMTLDLTIDYKPWFDQQQIAGPVLIPDSEWKAQITASFK